MKKALASALALTLLVLCLSGCSGFEYNAVILKEGFTLRDSFLQENNSLSENKTIVIDSQAELDEFFSDFVEIDLDTKTVIVYCYTTIYIREQRLERVSIDEGVLNIEFDIVKAAPGVGDATAPQTRVCVILLDKPDASLVKVGYNGQ